MNDSPSILVVGGSGFIGSHIVDRAVSLGWSVVSLGLSGHLITRYGNSVTYIAVDIVHSDVLVKALRNYQFDYVVNCGGYIDHQLFSSGGRDVIDSHFSGVMNLVGAINRKALKSFVNIGSSDEYGGASSPQKEGVREAPISPYSLAKAAATHFLQMLWRSEGFPATTLRLFLTYGPRQDTKRFIPQIIRGCLNDEVFPVSAGEQLRDFCYISDVVDAIFVCFQEERARGEVINVASGESIRIQAMIEMIVSIVGKGKPQYGGIPYRPGENMALYADISLAKSILNWSPKVKIHSGIEHTINWLRGRDE